MKTKAFFTTLLTLIRPKGILVGWTGWLAGWLAGWLGCQAGWLDWFAGGPSQPAKAKKVKKVKKARVSIAIYIF